MNRHSEVSKDENIITDFVPSGNGFITPENDAPEETVVTEVTDAPAFVEVIGVKFKESGKMYYFAPNGITASVGEGVIVETSRGVEYGTVGQAIKEVPASEIVPPLRSVLRLATEEDTKKRAEFAAKEKEAFAVCAEKINDHGLGMKLIDAEYTFDGSKLVFYFSADGRVDFRELVKDLASVFRTRIELRQIGIRDEAKLLGGLGVCGRPFCCTTFLTDFVQVSIKMAKEQNMSLNSSKISGTCGRLMCCLKYEHEAYEEEIRLTPPVGARVRTPEGTGFIKETTPITGKLKVTMDSDGETVKDFHRDDVTVIGNDDPVEVVTKKRDKFPVIPKSFGASQSSDAEGDAVSDNTAPPTEKSGNNRPHHRRRRPPHKKSGNAE